MAPSWTGMRHQRPLIQRGECRSHLHPPHRRWANCASATVTAAMMPWSPPRWPALDPPLLLGPPLPVKQQQWQYIDVDARPRSLRRRDDDVIVFPPGLDGVGIGRWQSNGCVLWLSFVGCCVLRCGNAPVTSYIWYATKITNIGAKLCTARFGCQIAICRMAAIWQMST